MIRQFFNILRPKALLLAAVVAAGCSDDDTTDGDGMSFLNGDNLFECPAEGGTKDISFFSRSGHWEIAPQDPEASWIDVWPAYGDDNGRTTLTVKAINDARDQNQTHVAQNPGRHRRDARHRRHHEQREVGSDRR